MFLCVLLPLCSVAVAIEDNVKHEAGIYFCTKDLDSFRSLSVTSDKSLYGLGSDYISVSVGDDTSHTLARHCFILLAEEMRKADSEKFALKIIDSAGYGIVRDKDKVGIVTSEKWLTNPKERDSFAVSCTRIKDDADGFIGEGTEALGGVIYFKWDKLVEDMKKEAKKENITL